MKTKAQINQEAYEIYLAIKSIMEKSGYDYCQSWWLNTRNFDLKSKLKTPQIVQRCKLLAKQGYLTIDKTRTSTSRGTCFKLTDKTHAGGGNIDKLKDRIIIKINSREIKPEEIERFDSETGTIYLKK